MFVRVRGGADGTGVLARIFARDVIGLGGEGHGRPQQRLRNTAAGAKATVLPVLVGRNPPQMGSISHVPLRAIGRRAVRTPARTRRRAWSGSDPRPPS